MGNSSRDKLNTIWMWIAAIVSILAGAIFNSVLVAGIVFAILIGGLFYTGSMRLKSRGRRGRRP